MSITLSKLKSTFKAFDRHVTDLQSLVESLVGFAPLFKYLLIHAESNDVYYYLKEFYLHVGFVFDIQDTIEFGRLRTDLQKTVHCNYIEPYRVGCYMAVPHDSDKMLQLTSCSHEGITYWLNEFEQSLIGTSQDEPTVKTAVEVLSLNLVKASTRLVESRKIIVELLRETVTSAFHARKPKNSFKMEGKNLAMCAYYSYSITFYQMVLNNKQWTTYHLFPELILAAMEEEERDFKADIVNCVCRAPGGESLVKHNTLLEQRAQVLAVESANRQAQQVLNAAHIAEQNLRKENGSKAKQQKKALEASITDPDQLREMELKRKKGKKDAMRCFNHSAGADGDGSSDESESDEEHENDEDNDNKSRKHDAKHKHKKHKSVGDKGDKHKRSSTSSPLNSSSSADVITPTISSKSKSKSSDKSLKSRTAVSHSSSSSTSFEASHGQLTSLISIPNTTSSTPHTPDGLNISINSNTTNESSNSAVSTVRFNTSNAASISRGGTNNNGYDDMFSGVAHDDSLLHDADVGSDVDSDDDAEFDFNNPGKLFQSASKGSRELVDDVFDDEGQRLSSNKKSKKSGKGANSRDLSSNKKKRFVTPEKQEERRLAQKLADESKAAKVESAKKKREEFKEERRVELANVTKELVSSDGTVRKKRMSSAISSELVQNYVNDFDLNRLASKSNSAIIAEVVVNELGPGAGEAAHANDDGTSSAVMTVEVGAPTLSSNEKMGLIDKTFKQGLMMYCQLELFKDVMFERLVVNYCIAKREACGAKDDELLDIDWFEVLSGFRVSLEKRLIDNKEFVLNSIKLAIDGIVHTDLTCIDREAEKQRYVDSAEAWVKHAVRLVRSMISKTIYKIGAYWEAMNFLPPGALKSGVVPGGTNKSALFANTFSQCNVFADEASVQPTSGVGIDALLSQIMKTGNAGDHMTSLVKFSLIPRDKYKIIPSNIANVQTWLEKTGATSPLSEKLRSPSASASPEERSSMSSSTGVDFASRGDHSPAGAPTNALLISTEMSTARRDGNSSVNSSNSTSEAVAFQLRELMKVLFAGVSSKDENMCLKMNPINNSRKAEMLSFLKFLEMNQDKTPEQMATNFAESTYFKLFTCGFFIPFLQKDSDNILGDGYCFYRALYMLCLRAEDGAYELSSAQMRELDRGLRLTENETRLKFHGFFEVLHNSLPEEYGKSRVKQARFLFFYILNCNLDTRFWGILDGVAYLPFNCTGFGEHSDAAMKQEWLKYYCNSLFGIANGSASIESGVVGSNPTFADVATVLAQQANYVLFRNNHYFVGEHKSVQNMQTSFEVCIEEMMHQMQNRFAFISGKADFESGGESSSSSVSSLWGDLFDRMAGGVSTANDLSIVRNAVKNANDELQRQKVDVIDTVEQDLIAKKKKPLVERAPAGASEEQKKIFSLNLKYQEAKLKLESLQSELDGIKRMIQKNLQAKETPIDLSTEESVELEETPIDLSTEESENIEEETATAMQTMSDTFQGSAFLSSGDVADDVDSVVE